MSTPELLNKIVRSIINGRTTKFKKLGMRKLKLGLVGGGEDEDLDVFSNTAFQVLLPLFAKTGDQFFGEKKITNIEVTTNQNFEYEKDQRFVNINENIKINLENQNEYSDSFKTNILSLKKWYDQMKEWTEMYISLSRQRENKLTLLNPFSDEITENEYPYQIDLVNTLIKFFNEGKHSLISYWPGVGKSLPCIHFSSLLINSRKSKFCFFVVPSAMLLEWERKFKIWDYLFSSFPYVYVVKKFDHFDKLLSFRRGRICIVSYDMFGDLMKKIEGGENESLFGDDEKNKWRKYFCNVESIFFDELHLKSQAAYKDIFPEEGKGKTYYNRLLFCKKILTKCMFVGITGTPFRNETSYINISNLLSDNNNQLNLKVIEKQLSDVFDKCDLFKLRQLISILKKPMKGRIFVEYPELDPIKLYNIIVEIECSSEQDDFFPSDLPNATNCVDYDINSLDAMFKSKKDYDKIKKKCKRNGKKLKYKRFFEKGFKHESFKLDLLISLLENIYDNKLDKEFASQLLNIDVKDIESDECPSHCFEKVLLTSKWPFLLKQLKFFLSTKCDDIEKDDFFEITGYETKITRDKRKKDFESSEFGIALLSTKVGGVGHTYLQSRIIIQLDWSWDHTWGFQTIFRPYRLNQKRNVWNFTLLVKGNDNDGQVTVLNRSMIKDLASRIILSKNDNDIYCEDVQEIDFCNLNKQELNFINVVNKFCTKNSNSKYYTYCSQMKELIKQYQDTMNM